MEQSSEETFLYFSYGSNLLKKRIHIRNPSAVFIGIGRLDDHQLDFIKYSEHWRGASATIIPTGDCPDIEPKSRYVWGAVWRLDVKDMPHLDWQEGVETGWYFPKTVSIITPENKELQCRTYQQTTNPPLNKGEWTLPPERLPSITYLECIVEGAIECELPEDYIEKLKRIPHNGQEAAPAMLEKLKK